MSKTTRKEKEQGYGICENNNQLEQKNILSGDVLSHIGEDTVYRAAAEAQSWFNNDFGRGVDALLTGRRSKFVSVMHQFPPLNEISFLEHQWHCLITLNATVFMLTG